MLHWSQLATRNWRVKRVRTAGALLAIALGVGAVVWVSCCYESVRLTVGQWAGAYVGRSQINIESPLGRLTQFSSRLLKPVSELPKVAYAAPLLVQRLRGKPIRPHDYEEDRRYDPWTCWEVDYNGIDVDREANVRDNQIVAGRMLQADDEFGCVVEEAWAKEIGLEVGDYLITWSEEGRTQYKLNVVGLVIRRRIARFQPPTALVRLQDLQTINNKWGFVTSIDVVLRDKDPKTIRRVSRQIRSLVRQQGIQANVRNAESRMRQVEGAQRQQDVVLGLLSCVAMLTALFIILSTLSMGMLERISQLGLLRCVGATGWQLATLVFVEVLPLGVIGIAAGMPLGLGLTALTVWLVPDYIGDFVISWWGMLRAAGAGLATTIVAASLPALSALSVSPLEASRPRARHPRRTPLIVLFIIGLALLAGQVFIEQHMVRRDFEFVNWSATAIVLLYLVYALAAPLAVWVLGSPAVMLMSRVIRVRSRLLQDQVGRAAWRSAGICCGLMVGLSLIVALVVLNTSFRAGWQFPREFAEAYIWSFDQINLDSTEAARRLAETPGIKKGTLANAVNVVVEEGPNSPTARVLRSATWFLGIDPDTFFDMMRMEFVEGDEETAKTLLKQGGHVLIAVDFARTRNKRYLSPDEEKRGDMSNKVRVWYSDRGSRTFRVAGVVDSPALDIAASFFQAQSEMRVVAVGSVIGTNADLKRYYAIEGVRLALVDFDLPPEPVPPGWPPDPDSADAAGLTVDFYDRQIPVDQRWQRWREEAVLRDLRARLGAPQAYGGTARALKDRIDSELTKGTYLLTAVPIVALLVAAIGVANLMTANVASRTKQLAILRAVGATRGQILRMVVGEALVLGVLGSGLGLALGLHLAANVTEMTIVFWGFEAPLTVPWGFVGGAVALTVGLCVLAGILPARHASRTNVIEALHVA
ncbi:MAG: FtsX-like permease family protein [Phycisphaerae bacterium]|jgi:putative ABC transport system permease protein